MSMDREKAILLLNKVQNHSDPKYQFWQVLEWALERDEAARRWARLAQELEQLNDRLSGETLETGIDRATWSTGDEGQYQTGAFTITEVDGASEQ